MKKNIIITIVIILLVFTGGYFSLSKKPKSDKPVKFGYLPISGSLALFVAEEKGFFQQEGLLVELIKFESSNPLAEALASGSIDAEIGTSTYVMAALNNKNPGKIKSFLMNIYDGNQYYITSIVAKQDSSISTVADLKGKKIGCFPGATNKSLTRIFLQKNGAYDDQTNIIEMAANLQLEALENKSLDAVSMYEPYTTIGLVSGKVKVIARAPVEKAVLCPWLAGTASINTEFAGKNPKKAQAIIKTLYLAADYMRSNPAGSKKSLTKYTPITDEKVLDALPLPKTLKAEEINPADWQKMIDLFYSEKLLDKKTALSEIIWK